MPASARKRRTSSRPGALDDSSDLTTSSPLPSNKANIPPLFIASANGDPQVGPIRQLQKSGSSSSLSTPRVPTSPRLRRRASIATKTAQVAFTLFLVVALSSLLLFSVIAYNTAATKPLRLAPLIPRHPLPYGARLPRLEVASEDSNDSNDTRNEIARATFPAHAKEGSYIWRSLQAVDQVVGRPEILARALTYKTVSYPDHGDINYSEFLRFHEFLEKEFPLVHSHLKKEVVNTYSLLFTWEGSIDQKNEVPVENRPKPVLLTAHMDVVPVTNESSWSIPPFDGRIENGFIWGRGAMDHKNGVICILDAIESLLAAEYKPQRTIYLALGHDEEIGGKNGARFIGELLGSRKVDLEFVLDEGLVVTEGIAPSIDKPVALVGVCEKGYITVRVTVNCPPGHSSMPPRHTAIGVLAQAIARLESNPIPMQFEDLGRELFIRLGPEAPLFLKAAAANMWLSEPAFKWIASKSKTLSSFFRTTQAVTRIRGGLSENVIPEFAFADINFRVMPGTTTAEVVEHVRKTLAGLEDIALKDEQQFIENQSAENSAKARPRIKIDGDAPGNGGLLEPSNVSSTKSIGYKVIEGTLRHVYGLRVGGDLAVLPGVMIANTDTKHYAHMAGNGTRIYRFNPFFAGNGDLGRIHGIDERLSIRSYSFAVSFWHELLRNLDS